MRRQMNSDPDQKTVDELIELALTESDEDAAWDAVVALHGRGTPEVLEKATALTKSDDPDERSLGADILGQLGRKEGVEQHRFPKESVEILLGMLPAEEEPEVLEAILTALSHLKDAKAIPAVAQLVKHPDAEVRHAAVLALMGHDDQAAIDLLIELSVDEDPEVRDWATFALGTQLEADAPDIRRALADRLEDPDDVVRGEALVGLARRKDDRVVPALKQELQAEDVEELFVGAAELIASPELHAPLLALCERWDGDDEVMERALAACEPADGDS